MALLELANVEIRYGQLAAVHDLSITVDEGEIVTLLGANGAGKTTTLRMISGLLRPHRGTVRFDGKEISSLVPHKIVNLGICHVPEGRRIFPVMSVEENLEMGAYRHRLSHHKAATLAEVFELFPVLHERRRQLGGDLSGGEQQMLAIGRALMGEPRVLLLDEPSMGLAPLFVERIFSIIDEIRRRGVTILLVEQNATKALELSDRGYVLETGNVVLSGPATELLGNDRVRMAYLGEDVTE
jgi:branched-chain amino acid transport system ATP-binding protein